MDTAEPFLVARPLPLCPQGCHASDAHVRDEGVAQLGVAEGGVLASQRGVPVVLDGVISSACSAWNRSTANDQSAWMICMHHMEQSTGHGQHGKSVEIARRLMRKLES